MIINLTQHPATADQMTAGVVDPPDRAAVSDLLTFPEPPTLAELEVRASSLVEIARRNGATSAMIGGAPFFMAALEWHLATAGITPLYAFSTRDSVERRDADGSVQKTQVFRHIGFVTAAPWRGVYGHHCEMANGRLASPWQWRSSYNEYSVLQRGNRLQISTDVDLEGLATLKEMLAGYETILKLIAGKKAN